MGQVILLTIQNPGISNSKADFLWLFSLFLLYLCQLSSGSYIYGNLHSFSSSLATRLLAHLNPLLATGNNSLLPFLLLIRL